MRRSHSFNNILGLDFNPVTGNLCDTGNGREFSDEMNLVTPGIDSGWI
jgi:glucose/arabinose dehydrogenase